MIIIFRTVYADLLVCTCVIDTARVCTSHLSSAFKLLRSRCIRFIN